MLKSLLFFSVSLFLVLGAQADANGAAVKSIEPPQVDQSNQEVDPEVQSVQLTPEQLKQEKIKLFLKIFLDSIDASGDYHFHLKKVDEKWVYKSAKVHVDVRFKDEVKIDPADFNIGTQGSNIGAELVPTFTVAEEGVTGQLQAEYVASEKAFISHLEFFKQVDGELEPHFLPLHVNSDFFPFKEFRLYAMDIKGLNISPESEKFNFEADCQLKKLVQSFTAGPAVSIWKKDVCRFEFNFDKETKKLDLTVIELGNPNL